MMTRSAYSLQHLTDGELVDGLMRVAGETSRSMAELLSHLAEVDARRLYLESGYSSLFVYAVERLGFSEDEAAKRIQAARAARLFPCIFELVATRGLQESPRVQCDRGALA